MSCTLVRRGNCAWFSTSGPYCRAVASSKGASKSTACGLPTDRQVAVKLRVADLERLLHPLVGAAPVHRQIGAAEADAPHRHAQDACDPSARATSVADTGPPSVCMRDRLVRRRVAVVEAELGEDARAVAALLGFGAVGVVDAHGGVEAGRRRHALEDAVGADAGVAVADGDGCAPASASTPKVAPSTTR